MDRSERSSAFCRYFAGLENCSTPPRDLVEAAAAVLSSFSSLRRRCRELRSPTADCTRTDLSERSPKTSKADLCFRPRHLAILVLHWSDSRCRRRGKLAGQYVVPRIEAAVRHLDFQIYRRCLELEGSRDQLMVGEEEVEPLVAPPSFAVSDRGRETK